jgi:hypothetical protein
MRSIAIAFVALAVAQHAARAQDPWPEPISAPWPLADLALQPGGDGAILLLAYPNPITAQSDTADTYLTLNLAPVQLRAWVPRARQFVDSVLKGPRDINDQPAGLTLPTDAGTGRLTLAHQPNTRPTSRFLLVIIPPPPGHGWSVRGGEETARRFLAALDSALVRGSMMTPPDPLALPENCTDMAMPTVTQRPRMTLPTLKRLGGRVVLEFVVDTSGTPMPASVRVLLSSGPEYTREAQREFSTLHYAPGQCNGHPVRVSVRQGFSWRMDLRR